MALPGGLITVTVQFGPYINDVGRPYTGRVMFSSAVARVWDSGSGTYAFMPDPVIIELDSSGAGSVQLAATDQPGFSNGMGQTVTNWTYTITRVLTGSSRIQDTHSFALPSGGNSGTTANIDTMIPVNSSTGVVVDPGPYFQNYVEEAEEAADTAVSAAVSASNSASGAAISAANALSDANVARNASSDAVFQAGLAANSATAAGNSATSASGSATSAANSLAAMPLWWFGTQAAYDALAVKDPNTLYTITG